MILSDIIVEVRDRNLVRVGALTSGFTLEATPLNNKVGSWTLTLPSDHGLVSTLRRPGSGIVVTGPDDVFISGPVTSPGRSVTTDAGDVVKFSGSCDNQWIADRLAYPDPAWLGAASPTPAADFDIRTGAAETVIHGYVNANVGPGAITGRRLDRLVMGPDLGRGDGTLAGAGGTITKSARFDPLAELISGIADASGLNWRVVQRGNGLQFETSEVVDRSKSVRLDVRNNTLAGYKLAVTAPTATHAIVGAIDVNDDRLFATVTTTDSEESSTDWGRRIETFVNQSYVEDEDEWTATARQILAEQGLTATSVQAIPNDDETLRYGRDYGLGDKIGIIADGLEYAAIVTGLVIKVDGAGVRIALALGDASRVGNSPSIPGGTHPMVDRIARRVDRLERTQGLTGFSVGSDWIFPTLTAGWAAWSDASNESYAYRKVGDEVEVIGLGRRVSGVSSVAFNIPAPYRPSKNAWGFATVNGAAGVCAVTSGGDVSIQTPAVVTGQFVAVRIRYPIASP